MAKTIQIRVEDELKSKSDALFKDLGIDTTTAIRMFLTQEMFRDADYVISDMRSKYGL